MKKILVLLLLSMPLITYALGLKPVVVFDKEPTINLNSNSNAPMTAIVEFSLQMKYDSLDIEITNARNKFVLKYSKNKSNDVKLPIYTLNSGLKHSFNFYFYFGKQKIKYNSSETLDVPYIHIDPYMLPKFDATKNLIRKAKPVLTLLNIERDFDLIEDKRGLSNNYGLLTLVNSKGEILWYYQTNSQIIDYGFLVGGKIFYQTKNFKTYEIDWFGDKINKKSSSKKLKEDKHHRFIYTEHIQRKEKSNGGITGIILQEQDMHNRTEIIWELKLNKKTQDSKISWDVIEAERFEPTRY